MRMKIPPKMAAAALLGAAALALLVGWAGDMEEERRMSGVPSVYNDSPSGFSFLYAALQSEGYPAEPYAKAFSSLRLGVDDGLIIAASPAAEKITETDADALYKWVEAGNWLFYLMDEDSSSPRLDEALLNRFHVRYKYVSGRPRWQKWAATGSNARPLARRPINEGVAAVKSQGGDGLRLTLDATFIPAAGDDFDIRIYTKRIGLGQLILSDSASIISNGKARALSNARFVLNAVHGAKAGPGEGRKILFSEYYHSRDPRKTTAGVLNAEGLLWPFFQFAVGLLILLAAYGRGLGDKLADEKTSNFTAPAYARAMARLAASFGRTNDKEMIYGELLVWRDKTCKLLGVPPVPPEILISRLAAWETLSAETARLREVVEDLKKDGASAFTLSEVSALCGEAAKKLRKKTSRGL